MAGRARVAQPLRPLDDPDDEWAALRAQFLPTPVKQEQVTPEKYRQVELDAEESEGGSFLFTSSTAPDACRRAAPVSSTCSSPRAESGDGFSPAAPHYKVREQNKDQEVTGKALELCHCCDQRRYPGHRWCAAHKKVYDSLVKDITSKKKLDPERYKQEMAAHQLTMKDLLLSAQKVLQFEHDHPEVVKGKKRGTFDHVQFFETMSKRTYSRDESWGKWMDFIEYSRKMERKRGWTVGQSSAKWKWWLQQPGIKSDMKGEDPGFEQRILLPKGDFAIIGTDTIEEKAIQIVGRRQKSISTEAFRSGLDNLGTGHQGVGGDFHSGVGSASLASVLSSSGVGAAFARAGSQPGLIELANAAAAKGEAELAARQAAVDRQAAAEVAAENGGSKEEQDKQQQEDLVSQRVPTFRKLTAQAAVLRKKHAADFATTHMQLHMDSRDKSSCAALNIDVTPPSCCVLFSRLPFALTSSRQCISATLSQQSQSLSCV